MKTAGAVAAAGALGALARHGLGLLLPGGGGAAFPWATLAANVCGSLLLGLLLGGAARTPLPDRWREAAGTGFLGAFTTYGAFSAELTELWRHQAYAAAAAYALLSAAGGWLAAAAGLRLGRRRRG